MLFNPGVGSIEHFRSDPGVSFTPSSTQRPRPLGNPKGGVNPPPLGGFTAGDVDGALMTFTDSGTAPPDNSIEDGEITEEPTLVPAAGAPAGTGSAEDSAPTDEKSKEVPGSGNGGAGGPGDDGNGDNSPPTPATTEPKAPPESLTTELTNLLVS